MHVYFLVKKLACEKLPGHNRIVKKNIQFQPLVLEYFNSVRVRRTQEVVKRVLIGKIKNKDLNQDIVKKGTPSSMTLQD